MWACSSAKVQPSSHRADGYRELCHYQGWGEHCHPAHVVEISAPAQTHTCGWSAQCCARGIHPPQVCRGRAVQRGEEAYRRPEGLVFQPRDTTTWSVDQASSSHLRPAHRRASSLQLCTVRILHFKTPCSWCSPAPVTRESSVHSQGPRPYISVIGAQGLHTPKAPQERSPCLQAVVRWRARRGA